VVCGYPKRIIDFFKEQNVHPGKEKEFVQTLRENRFKNMINAVTSNLILNRVLFVRV
jgi:hypothetical protein